MAERWCLKCMQDVQWWQGGGVYVHEDTREVRCWPDDPNRPDEATPAPLGMRGIVRGVWNSGPGA